MVPLLRLIAESARCLKAGFVSHFQGAPQQFKAVGEECATLRAVDSSLSGSLESLTHSQVVLSFWRGC